MYAIWERVLRGNRKELWFFVFFWRSHRGRFLSWEKGRPFGTGTPKRVAILVCKSLIAAAVASIFAFIGGGRGGIITVLAAEAKRRVPCLYNYCCGCMRRRRFPTL